jgi:hypothetical protein
MPSPDDGVARVLDLGVGHGFAAHIALPMPRQRSHANLSVLTLGNLLRSIDVALLLFPAENRMDGRCPTASLYRRGGWLPDTRPSAGCSAGEDVATAEQHAGQSFC